MTETTQTNGIEHPLENADQAKAFELYVQQPADKDLNKIAKAIKKAPSTILSWKSKYKWVPRLKSIQREARMVGKELVDEYVMSDMAILNTLKAYGFSLAIAKLNRYKSGMEELSMGDIVKFVNMVKVEMGEPTTIQAAIPQLDGEGVFEQLLNLQLRGLEPAKP